MYIKNLRQNASWVEKEEILIYALNWWEFKFGEVEKTRIKLWASWVFCIRGSCIKKPVCPNGVRMWCQDIILCGGDMSTCLCALTAGWMPIKSELLHELEHRFDSMTSGTLRHFSPSRTVVACVLTIWPWPIHQKWIWNCRLQSNCHVVSASMC